MNKSLLDLFIKLGSTCRLNFLSSLGSIQLNWYRLSADSLNQVILELIQQAWCFILSLATTIFCCFSGTSSHAILFSKILEVRFNLLLGLLRDFVFLHDITFISGFNLKVRWQSLSLCHREFTYLRSNMHFYLFLNEFTLWEERMTGSLGLSFLANWPGCLSLLLLLPLRSALFLWLFLLLLLSLFRLLWWCYLCRCSFLSLLWLLLLGAGNGSLPLWLLRSARLMTTLRRLNNGLLLSDRRYLTLSSWGRSLLLK